MTAWQENFTRNQPQISLEGGDAEKFDVRIDKVNLIGGQEVVLHPDGVNVIVGSNNVGKSTLLREAHQLISRDPLMAPPQCLSVDSLELRRSGQLEDLICWLGNNADFIVEDYGSGFQRDLGVTLQVGAIERAWLDSGTSLGDLSSFAIFYGSAAERFQLSTSFSKRNSIGDPPQHPVHYLEDSKDLQRELSRISEKIFGKTLTLDLLGGQVAIRIGNVEMESPRIDDIPKEYANAMLNLPLLEDQGDGMRSLMGQILPLITSAYKVVIIDEPEAFLHPPQAQALGYELGKLSETKNLQIIVATHDRNFISGLLSSKAKIGVTRLSRTPSSVSANQLHASGLETLRVDPVLKYTNVLDGLFHQLVVLAEAEGDCGYLAAALDYAQKSESEPPKNEILFVPTGGKDGMAKAAKALTSLSVPVVAAPDLDMLNDKSKLRKLVESLGAQWTDNLDTLWRRAAAQMNQSRPGRNVAGVREEINVSLKKFDEQKFSKQHRELVNEATRVEHSPWDNVKIYGVRAFKKDSLEAVNTLLELLAEIGIVLVEEGELEQLAPTVATRKGPEWLRTALEGEEQGNEATQKHIRKILVSGSKRI